MTFQPLENAVRTTLHRGIPALTGAALWLCLGATSQARLGPQYQMPLGNPDGASTNSVSRTKFLINQRAQYVISYNDDTHQANWVGWSYSLADDGTQARTDYWQTEELLPSGYLKIGTATFGTGWDRGHMCPSADRTKDLTNNQVTFRMSNIIPQASQNNQGLWANFEDYCRTLAANGDEIIIISGPAQFTGTRLNNQMSVPGSVWKIAVEIPNATSATPANERIGTNARVIALLTPNTSTGLGPWQSYITSVEHLEEVTGLTFFDAITNRSTAIYLKNLVDTGNGPNSPTVITTFNPTLGAAGTTVTISGYNFGTTPVVQFNGLQAAVQSATATSITATVPSGATSGYITVTGTSGTDTSYEPFTVSAGNSPTLSVTPNVLSGLTANQNSAGSAVAYALTGSLLTTNVVVTAPPNFEVSKDGGATFADTQSIAPDITGSLGIQLYARIKTGAAAGNISGIITHTSSTASAAVAISGAVISTTPSLSLSTNSITGLFAPQNSPGTSRSYTVFGSNLTGNVTVSAPAGFEVSMDNTTFAGSVSFQPSSGVLNNVPVYIRLATSGTVGAVSGTITNGGGGAATVNLSVYGDITSTAPSLILSTNSISGFTAVQNNPGGSKTYTISGTFLTSTVTIGAPSGFEVGTNATVFTNSLVLSPSSGTLANTTIYARLAASASTGSKSGTIIHTSGGVAKQDVSVAGTVNAATAGETWIATSGTNTKGLINTNQSLVSKTGVWLNEFHYDTAGIDTNEFVEVVVAPDVTNNLSAISVVLYNGNNSSAYSTNTLSAFALGSTLNGYRIFSLTYPSNGIQNGGSTTPEPDGIAIVVGGTAVQFLSYEGIFTAANGPAAGMTSTDIGVAELGAPTGSSLQLTGSGAPASLKPVITSGTTAGTTANSLFSYQITANNSPTYFSASGLPAGLKVDNTTGLISGTTTTPGTYSILLTTSNANGDGTATLTITVDPQPAPSITSALTTTGAVNAAFQYQITASNSPTSFGVTGLPPGLSLDNTTGLISGTPTLTGVYSVTITASNASGTGTANMALNVNPDPNAPVVSGPFTAIGAVGAEFSYQIAASNSPTAYLADNLPAGLVVDPITGTISGAPAAAGVSNVVITAANAFGNDQKTLTITVLAPVIAVSQTDMSFTNSFGQASATQIYSLSGSDLAEAVTVLAPGNFEINDNGGTNYVDELTISPASDRTLNAMIRVRMKASAPLGESSGAVINSGANAIPKYVQLTGFSDVTAATLDLSAWNLSGFGTKTGTPSLTQSYTLSGVGLTGPVTLTASACFQISSDNTTFSNTFVLSPDTSGKISAREIFVRFSSTTAGTFSGSIEHSGGGASSKYLTVSGTATTPIGPPIISPLSGSSYTNTSFTTKIAVGGSLPAISFGATNLPGSLQINRTNGTITGIVPSIAGASIIPVSATTQDGTTATNYSLRVVGNAEQNSIPTSVVINKFQNGLPDRVELLVIGDTNDAAPGPPVDMRGMILKDFAADRSSDQGGKYRFTTNALWSSVKAGTLIVLSAGTQSAEQTNATNFVLRVNLGNEAFLKQEAPGFDIDDFDMLMIKPANMGAEGFAGGIHAMAAGRITGQTLYGSFTGKKLRSYYELNNSQNIVYAKASSLSGYSSSSSSATGTDSGNNIAFGSGNNVDNSTYIDSLRKLDQTPPVVTLNGSAAMNLALGATYVEQGAMVTGGTSPTATVTGTVNTSTAGTYLLTYSAIDSSGNLGTATRTVNVAKGTPSITQPPTPSAIVSGQKLSASALSGGSASIAGTFNWTNPNQTVSTAGTASYEVTFTPSDATNYNTVTAMVALTSKRATTFDTWVANYNLAGADAATSADPDRDGLSNALEFDLGSNPARGDGWARGISSQDGQLKVTYLQRKGANFSVQTSPDLVSGFNAAATPSLTSPQPGDITGDYEQYEVTVPPVNGRMFLRIRAIQP